METELTRRMKKGLIGFKPLMSPKMHTIRYAEEVWTPTGIVDFIRFEDYQKGRKEFCELINYETLNAQKQELVVNVYNNELGKCKFADKGLTFPNDCCKNCWFKKSIYEVDMLVTCYECKISLSDFKSPHGHNFHGNHNYYVTPKYLVDDIKNLVPEDIGIISYYPDTNNYRITKECKFKEISHELKEKLLYDAFKKWIDKRFPYFDGGTNE